MVVLVRARAGNRNGHMTFYLCAGEIGGPTEDCTVTSRLETDGKWHYCLLDLSDKQTWAGTVHGWRFDMINAPAAAGDYVDYASVQFFRTKRAAEQVARGNPLRPDTVYHSGDAPVMRDDREELGGEQSAFTPDPADLYTPSGTETGTETATEPMPGRHRNAAGSGNGHIRADRRNGYGVRDRHRRHRAGLPLCRRRLHRPDPARMRGTACPPAAQNPLKQKQSLACPGEPPSRAVLQCARRGSM